VPSTGAILTRITELCHGWNRTGTHGALPYLNEIHRYMVSHDAETNVVLNNATGLPPYLATTLGTYSYACPDNCRKVASVFVAINVQGYEYEMPSDAYRNRFLWRGIEYREVGVTTRPQTRNGNATVHFGFNPGTTTTQYFLKYYIIPTEILSINTNLDIPDQYHDLVIDGVVARIRQVEYGDAEPYLNWKKVRVGEEYWQEANENPVEDGLVPLRWG
jgi:hypothetical protein